MTSKPEDPPADMPEEMDGAEPAQNDAELDAEADAAAEIEAKAAAEAEAEERTDLENEPEVESAAGAATSFLEAEIGELKDKLLRAVADAENTRRIAAREKDKAAKYAISEFARDMLGVGDYLGMALMNVSEEARKTDQNLDNLCVGVEMTQRELLNVFERRGIKPVPAEGHPFDHNVHEAVQQVPNPDVAEGTVVGVLRGGFMIQDRLLRPAQVMVSTGGAKAESAPEAVSPIEPETPSEGQEAYEPGDPKPGGSVDQET